MVNTFMKEHLLNDLHLRKDYELCHNNPVAFMRLHTSIEHPTKGVVKFSPNIQQQKLIQAYHNGHTIVDGDRRSGVTLTTAMFILWYAMYNNNKTLGILSNKQDQSIDVLRPIRCAYDCFPEWLKESNPLIQNNKVAMAFENGSRIHAYSSSPSQLRGRTHDLMFFDNFEIHDVWKQEDLLSTVLPVMLQKKDSRVLITSTVRRNDDSPYFKILSMASAGHGDFQAVEIRTNPM